MRDRAAYRTIAPLAYMGKKDCESSMCRRMVERQDDGTYRYGPCMGWHCSYCDAPCGSMGHHCDAAKTLIEAARAASAGSGESETT